MMELSEDEWRRAFPAWLRTGRLPSIQKGDAIERKFNPWHDPEDGRFTFAGSGNYHGASKGRPASSAQQVLSRRNPRKPQVARAPRSEIPRTEQPNRAIEFASGVGEGAYGVAKGSGRDCAFRADDESCHHSSRRRPWGRRDDRYGDCGRGHTGAHTGPEGSPRSRQCLCARHWPSDGGGRRQCRWQSCLAQRSKRLRHCVACGGQPLSLPMRRRRSAG